MRSYTAKKNTKHLTQNEIFEQQMVRQYFLFCANCGLRSGEIRQLKWYNVSTYKEITKRKVEGIFANVLVERRQAKYVKHVEFLAEEANTLKDGSKYVKRMIKS